MCASLSESHLPVANTGLSWLSRTTFSLGVGGSGRHSAARLAAHMADYEYFTIEISRNYGQNDWHDDLKKLMIKAGLDGRPTVFLFADSQIKMESFMEDISMLLNSGDLPNLFPADEKAELLDKLQSVGREAVSLRLVLIIEKPFSSVISSQLYYTLAAYVVWMY